MDEKKNNGAPLGEVKEPPAKPAPENPEAQKSAPVAKKPLEEKSAPVAKKPAENAKPRSDVKIVIDRSASRSGGIDSARLISEMQSYSFPRDKAKIDNLLSFIENGAVQVDSGNIMKFIENLAKWGREAREIHNTGFLQQLASCARKIDERSESSVDFFFALWKIVPDIANSVGDCKKVITNVIDSHTDDYDIVLTNLLPFFQKADHYKFLPDFFEVVFPEDDNNSNRELVSSAWNKLLCDEKINQMLVQVKFWKKDGRAFRKVVDDHAHGRQLPSSYAKYKRDKVRAGFKLLGIGAAAVAAVIIISIVTVILSGKAMNPDSIVIDYPTEATVSFGNELDLGGKTVSYETNNGEKFTVALTSDMVKGFNPNKVGKQTVTIQYGGKSHTVIVTVEPITLAAPEVSLKDGKIAFTESSGAGKYLVVLVDTNGNVKDERSVETLTYELPAELENGAYDVTVTAKSTAEQYVDSAASKVFRFEKRDGVTGIKYEGGRIIWDKLDMAKSYRVTVGDEQQDANTNEIKWTLAPGNNKITVSVVYDGGVIFRDSTIYIKKIDTPAPFIIADVLDSDIAGTVFYLNGVQFEKERLAELTVTPGEYNLKAKVFATNENEVDSDEFEGTIVRLPKPKLSIRDNALSLEQSGYKAVYYLDGVEFDGNIIDLTTPQDYTVWAKFVAGKEDKLVLSSDVSNTVTFTKLPIPTISSVGGSITIENAAAKYELYVNGVLFDGNIDNLTPGYHKITARNVGNGVDSISSAQSDEVKVAKVNASVVTDEYGADAIKVFLSTNLDKTKYPITFDIELTYYVADTKINSTPTVRQDCTEPMLIEILPSYSGNKADKAEIKITMKYPEFDSIVVSGVWTKNP